MLIRPERFFLVVGFLLGMTFLVITPPFQAPDEVNHFYRAWQVSEGQLTGIKADDRVGGTVPVGVYELSQSFRKFPHLICTKTNGHEILAAGRITLRQDSAVFRDFPNTALYTPVSYAPQAITIFVLRQFHLPPLYILYGTRLFTLLVWLVVIYYAIRLLPAYRWLFTLLALLPMSVFANLAMSADMVTNATAFFTIAYILRCAFTPGTFARRNLVVLLVLAVVLASAKIVYTPLLLLVFLVPREKFSSRKYFFLQTGSILVLAFVTGGFWSSIIGDLYTPYSAYNPLFRDGIDLMPKANVSEEIDYIFSHDTYLLRAILRSLKESAEMYVPGYIGTFGWLDNWLPLWFVALAYAVLFFTAFFGDNEAVRFNSRQRLLVFGVLILLTSIVITSQLLSWEPVGSGRVVAMQGRYFIAVFPLLFLFGASLIRRSLKITSIVVMLFTVLSGCIAVDTVYRRYYCDPVDQTMIVRCGAEERYRYDYFITDQPNVYLDNATRTQGQTHVRTGGYSFELDSINQYSGGLPLYNMERGDSLYAEIWRYGDAGIIVLSVDSLVLFTNTAEQEADGWQKIAVGYKFQEKPTDRVMFYLFTFNKPEAYFDDFEIRYFKANE